MAIQDLNNHANIFVSIAELAAYWRVSRRYLYRQVELGALDAIKLGPRSYRISVASALQFERAHSSSDHWTTSVATDGQSTALGQRRSFPDTQVALKGTGS
jgi:excisionase family DNA binding protein